MYGVKRVRSLQMILNFGFTTPYDCYHDFDTPGYSSRAYVYSVLAVDLDICIHAVIFSTIVMYLYLRQPVAFPASFSA